VPDDVESEDVVDDSEDVSPDDDVESSDGSSVRRRVRLPWSSAGESRRDATMRARVTLCGTAGTERDAEDAVEKPTGPSAEEGAAEDARDASGTLRGRPRGRPEGR
jgi:hypothetical protein